MIRRQQIQSLLFLCFCLFLSFTTIVSYSSCTGEPCSKDAECDRGKHCANGVCVAECEKDEDCDGKKCSSRGKCIEQTQEEKVSENKDEKAPQEQKSETTSEVSKESKPDSSKEASDESKESSQEASDEPNKENEPTKEDAPSEKQGDAQDEVVVDEDVVESKQEQVKDEPVVDTRQCNDGDTVECYAGPQGTKGVGECKAGKKTCVNGLWSACVGQVLPVVSDSQCGRSSEPCDGKDNNCDGTTDENCTCNQGATRACGSKEGECKQGTQTCNCGKWEACVGEVKAAKESCDGLDNDCDGQTDEDFAKKGQSCTVGSGSCVSTGTYICNQAKDDLVCDTKPKNSKKEECNGKDDDCDGNIDNIAPEPCYEGSHGTKDVAGCQGGHKTCRNGSWSKCEGQTLPSKEVCNGKDDDCDGKTDEDYSNLGKTCFKGTGECQTSSIWECKSDGSGLNCPAQAKSPAAESCNGKDDDCDGQTDEDFLDLGKSCSVGKGECIASSTWVCKSDGTGLDCPATAKTPGTEVCDGKDNDCDGSVDENMNQVSCYDGSASTKNKGSCKEGQKSCVNGSWTSCQNQVLPKTEICDGKDNDCDGETDETFTNLGKVCSTGQGACSASASWICKNDGSATYCPAVGSPSSKETCNNQDDDCDGQTDEGLTDVSCFDGDANKENKGLCKSGKRTCTAGQWSACSGQVLPVDEVCDNKDNNCDGKVDEDLTNVSCYNGAADTKGKGHCQSGVRSCTNGSWSTCLGEKLPETEVCDGLDNDCDGQVDNGFSSTPTSTGSGWEKKQVSCVNGKLVTEHELTHQVVKSYNFTRIFFNKDGSKLITGGAFDYRDLTLRSYPDGTVEKSHRFEKSIEAIAIAPDRKTMAVRRWLSQTIAIYDSTTGTTTSSFDVDSYVYGMAFSPDGKHLALSLFNKKIEIWDVTTKTKVQTFTGVDAFTDVLAYSPDGKKLASGSEDNLVRVWNLSTSKAKTFTGHLGDVRSLAWSPDGKTLASGSDYSERKVILWKVSDGTKLFTTDAHYSTVYHIAFSPDGKTLASATSTAVHFWKVSDGSQRKKLSARCSKLHCFDIHPNGQVLAIRDQYEASKIQYVAVPGFTTSTTSIATLGGISNTVAINQDGSIAAIGDTSGSIVLWDLKTNTQIRKISAYKSSEAVRALVFSPDGKTLIAGSNYNATIKMWEVSSGNLLHSLKKGSSGIYSLAYSSDGKTLASGGVSKKITLWDTTTGKELVTLPQKHDSSIRSLSFSPDGKTLASGGFDKGVYLWDVAGQKLKKELTKQNGYVYALAYSPDGKTLAIASSKIAENFIELWDPVGNSSTGTLKGHKSSINSITFHKDGKYLASSGYDGDIILWDVTSKKEVNVFKELLEETLVVRFSGDGNTLVAVGSDFHFWVLP